MTLATTEAGAVATQQQNTIQHTEATMSLVGWSTELDAAYNLATMICQTAFVPQHFRGKPEETAVAMLYGHTLGLAPMVAVKSIYVVHGAPALYAQAMYAIALSMGHQIERVYADDQRVEFRAKRRGQQNWQKVEWTIERARKAKYTSNGKYQENPIGMLTEKCKAEAAKLVAPDALAGMNSVEEIELGDYEDSPAETTPEPEKPKTKVTRKTRTQRKPAANAAPETEKPAVVDTPVDEDDTPVDDPSSDDVAMCTPDQWKALQTALATAGYETQQDGVAAIQEQLGRTLNGWQEITTDEATNLTAFFNIDPTQEG